MGLERPRMTRPHRGGDFWRRYRAPLALAAVFALGVFLYTARLRHNPPGFYVDESSVAYNADTISRTGRDEFGEAWPLYFRAFSDYKNPLHVYLLAALFWLTGPGILAARLLSALAGVVTALLLGRLGTRLSGRRDVGLLLAATALLTPWLFELSRVVLEVALYPLAVTLFLLTLRRASAKERWSWPDAFGLAATLALLTYTYSIGRLFAPLLALGLVLFATRARLPGIIRTWALYVLTLLPLFVFQRRHPDALTGRFNLITYITPQSSAPRVAWEFVKHFAGNLDPRRLLVTGDTNIWQVAHVQGTPAMLAATMLLAIAGVWLVLRRHRRDAWWRFVLWGLAASIVPASLTADYFHTLRLASLPVFLLVLMVPALAWLRESNGRRRVVALIVLVSLTFLQGAVFQWQYYASERDAWRRHLFDADYPPKIFDAALAPSSGTIYLADAMPTPYIQAYWYATLRGVPLSRFVRLAPDESPPAGALVISTEESCAPARVLAQAEPYRLYVASETARTRGPLPDGAFRAGIVVPDASAILVGAGEKLTIRTRVRNDGDAVWPGCERSAGRFQVHLASHWLDGDGRAASKEEGRTPLPADLAPGAETELVYHVNAPTAPGDYVLELDMLQEGVTWFGLKGSPTTKVRVKVE